jgi:hypothetical protein
LTANAITLSAQKDFPTLQKNKRWKVTKSLKQGACQLVAKIKKPERRRIDFQMLHQSATKMKSGKFRFFVKAPDIKREPRSPKNAFT